MPMAVATVTSAPQVTPTANAPTPAPGFQQLTDSQFGYAMTLPSAWHITQLNGALQGAPDSPRWSALIANVEIPSLQSLNDNTDFVISIYRQPMTSENDLLLTIADRMIAQPGDILRRTQGATVEYYAAKMLPDSFGRPTQARWFWNGRETLSVTVLVLNPSTTQMTQIDQALDSVQLLNP